MMTIKVNGEPHALSESLNTLLDDLGMEDAPVATALNGIFVPQAERNRAFLKAGDEVEILAPMQGG